MVQDEITPPGYCKMQLAQDGQTLWGNKSKATECLSLDAKMFFKFSPDKNNRFVCSYNPPDFIVEMSGRRQGPSLALDDTGLITASDLVFAFKNDNFSECAAEWLTRRRDFKWPTAEMTDTCLALGCLFVAVGHPASDEQHQLWRMSLSRQENHFVTHFNSVQLKCYILLKIIKKELISPYNPESLTSYHIKTRMLYMRENTPAEFWRPENLRGCMVTSLKVLSRWAEDGNCPNYFIPEENMFDRLSSDQIQKLYQQLQDLIFADCKYLAYLKTEHVGEYLQVQSVPLNASLSREEYLIRITQQQQRTKLALRISQCQMILRHSKLYSRWTIGGDTVNSLLSLYRTIDELRGEITQKGSAENMSRKAVSLILPYFEINLMSSLVASAVKQGKPREEIWSLLASSNWERVSKESD